MMQKLPTWWRMVCLAHFIIALLFGVVFLLAPNLGMSMIAWDIVDPFTDRLLGAALLAMAWAHFVSSKETSIEKISIPLQFYWIFDIMGTILSLWVAITYHLWSGWLLVVIFGSFFAAYSLVLLKK